MVGAEEKIIKQEEEALKAFFVNESVIFNLMSVTPNYCEVF